MLRKWPCYAPAPYDKTARGATVAIDFTFPDEVEDARLLVRKFMRDTVGPKMAELRANKAKREEWGL